MQQLTLEQFALAQPLFAELATFNISIAAVLAGTAPGEVYVDNMARPRVGFAATPEGEYLAGDVIQRESFAALKELIPPLAYLTFDPTGWEAHLGEIWTNTAARRHPRYHLRLADFKLPDWRTRIPVGFEIVPVDQAFLTRRDLKNHAMILRKLDGWHSHEYFLAHGFGFCALDGDTIASGCVADNVVEEMCEMGIATDISYRRRGLATVVVAAAVEHCLARGLTQIGWHCLQSNRGSIGVAERVGFVKVRDYFAYSSFLPTENAADMSVAEVTDWAEHFERFIPGNFRYGFDAAVAWTLAGDTSRAMTHLRTLLARGWRGRPEWLADNWVLAALRGQPEFEDMIAILREQEDNKER